MRRTMSGRAAALVLLLGSLVVAFPTTIDPPVADAAATGASRFVPVAPTRILDTREGLGAPTRSVSDGETIALQVTDRAGVPASAVAVALNITATNTTAPGFVSAWPTGESRPVVSNLNVENAGQTIANFAVVRLGAGGQVSLFAFTRLDLVADVTGYWVPSDAASGGRYMSAGPARILDTREGIGKPVGPVPGGQLIDFQVTGQGGVPASGVSAVILNVTATNATGPGYVTAWPTGAPQPLASSLNVERPGQTIPNLAIIPIGTGGRVSLYAFATLDLVVDVLGYFTDETTIESDDGLFVPATPARILDTRTPDLGVGAYAAPIPAGQRSDLQVAGRGGVANAGVAAVIVNATATNPLDSGFVTLWPAATVQPLASNLNVDHSGQTIANLAIVPLGHSGRISTYSYSQVDLVIDVSGWFTGQPTPSTPGVPLEPPLSPCAGVRVSPGLDLQAVFDSQPPGSTFCLDAGTYHLTEAVIPKSGSTIVGAPGTILTGDDVAPAALVGSGASQADVTVRGITFERFTNSGTNGHTAAVKTGKGWIVESNEMRLNHSAGLALNTGVVAQGNYVHHNGQYGMIGDADNATVAGNEIAFNNTRGFDENWDAGGTKFIKSSDLVIRDNYVHDNKGPGLWCDTDCIRVTFEGNRVERNTNAGIFQEIGYDAVIRDNTLRFNASLYGGNSIWWGADIRVHTSSNVEIVGNTIDSTVNGIGLVDLDRGAGAYGAYETRNAWVHDNTIRLHAGATTAAGLVGRPQAFAADIRFEENHYTTSDTTGTWWEWQGARTASEWRNAGHDVSGTFIQ